MALERFQDVFALPAVFFHCNQTLIAQTIQFFQPCGCVTGGGAAARGGGGVRNWREVRTRWEMEYMVILL